MLLPTPSQDFEDGPDTEQVFSISLTVKQPTNMEDKIPMSQMKLLVKAGIMVYRADFKSILLGMGNIKRIWLEFSGSTSSLIYYLDHIYIEQDGKK